MPETDNQNKATPIGDTPPTGDPVATKPVALDRKKRADAASPDSAVAAPAVIKAAKPAPGKKSAAKTKAAAVAKPAAKKKKKKKVALESAAAVAPEPAEVSADGVVPGIVPGVVPGVAPVATPRAAPASTAESAPAATAVSAAAATPVEAPVEATLEPSAFAMMGLHPRLVTALAALGFETPTPIQTQAIPPLLAGSDLIGRARTGSGKTAAFGLPLLHRVANGPGRGAVRALVLAPTRELALQVTDAMRDLAKDLDLPMVTVYGGTSYGPQLDALRRGVAIVVGTPGRLIDLLDKGALSLSDVEMVVLDEADEMLRMGFVEDVERMLAETPQRRQVALFSATMPSQIRRVADKHLRNPIIIEAEGGSPVVDHISQQWMRVPQRFKAEALLRVLQAHTTGAALVFARTKAGCDAISSVIRSSGMQVDALHGDLNQAAREQVVSRLRDQQTRFVIATDVAARGIDVEHITLVVNLDLPDNAEVYTHRIGRTGRAGRAGRALTLVTPGEVGRFRGQMRQLKTNVDEAQLPTEAVVLAQQLSAISTDIDALLEDDTAAAGRAWAADLLEAGEHSLEDLAAAALAMLAAERGVNLVASPSEQLPPWASQHQGRQQQRGEYAPRDRNFDSRTTDSRSTGSRTTDSRTTYSRTTDSRNAWGRDDGPARQNRPQRPMPHQGGDEDHVDLFLPIGTMHRIRPGDLVGALANEAGVPGQAIGRITVRDRVSFVSMPRQLAERVVADRETLELRGMQVPVMIARPQATDSPDRQQSGGGEPRSQGHPGHRDPPQRPYDQARGAPQGQPYRGNDSGQGRGAPQGAPPRWTSRRTPGDRPFTRRKPK